MILNEDDDVMGMIVGADGQYTIVNKIEAIIRLLKLVVYTQNK